MKIQHFAVIALAINALSNYTERVGRTHIQKFLFLAENWFLDMSHHTFEMYRYGPYSFDLDGEVQALRSVGVIDMEPSASGYGARYSIDSGQVTTAVNKGGIPQGDQRKIKELAKWIAPKRVRELEAIGTAEFIARSRPNTHDDEVIKRVIEIKPHLERREVQGAVRELNEMRAKLQA